MGDFLFKLEETVGSLLLMGIFIFVMIRSFKKYIAVCDRFKLDVLNRCVKINKERVFFEEIDYVTVCELEQPNAFEKAILVGSRSGDDYLYMMQIIFHLKDGCEKECTFNKRTAFYKALKQLQPYVPVRAYIEDFKPEPVGCARYIYIVMLVGILLLILLFHN